MTEITAQYIILRWSWWQIHVPVITYEQKPGRLLKKDDERTMEPAMVLSKKTIEKLAIERDKREH